MTNQDHKDPPLNGVAVIGMALRVPGASDLETFWRNLCQGVESVTSFSDEELRAAGVSEDLLSHPDYVKSGAVLDDLPAFDAELFGFSPKEAAIMDPQHRHFLENAWEALEDAGHTPEGFDGSIGVFAGCGMGGYMMFNLLTNPELVDSVGMFLLRHTGNDKDFLTTRLSYCLNLTGPSVNIQTACSTSLVAVHAACQSLLNGECDLALAGGVTIEIPHNQGYLYKEGEILSPDGHCRPFDHRARGTIFGSGVGVVVLRPLEEALEQGDHIYAVIRASAVNNDGAAKIGYLAPSVDGQEAAVLETLEIADVAASTIDYVECHGTGTPMGDPIEIAALTRAFRQTSEATGYCAIGSVKSNIGHLDTAAGIVSLIKTALAIHHGKIPPSLHFEAPNPELRLQESPFYVNDRTREWPQNPHPRRACVNSLGVGGTNAHLLLEEPPSSDPDDPAEDDIQLLTFSANNRQSLEDYLGRFARHLRENPPPSLADAAYTLHFGRRAFPWRCVLAHGNAVEAAQILESHDPRFLHTHMALQGDVSVSFMFGGGGSQYPRMGMDLYREERLFREHMDRGLAWLEQRQGLDLRPLIFAEDRSSEEAEAQLWRPSLQLPALFLIQYALARLWMSKGVQPKALIGHSMGENTAACIAGVLSFEECLGLVALRGRLFETLPNGGMISVPLPKTELEPFMAEGLDLAVINGPELHVLSGPEPSLTRVLDRLCAQGVEARRIPIEVAAHSRALDAILEEFGAYLETCKLREPRIPFISNLTGDWIDPAQAATAGYWVAHLRQTVLFGQGMTTLLEQSGRIFLEIGPGKTLCSLTRQNPSSKPETVAIPSMRHRDEDTPDNIFFLTAMGRLWATGALPELERLWRGQRRNRAPLPTYAFRKRPYWIEPGKPRTKAEDSLQRLMKTPSKDDWFYAPVWERAAIAAMDQEPTRWLIFLDETGPGNRVARHLSEAGHEVLTVRESDTFERLNETEYALSPERGRTDYTALVHDLLARGKFPSKILHLWMLTTAETYRPGSSFFHRNQERGFYSLFYLAKALGGENIEERLELLVFGNGMRQVDKEPLPYPEKATLLGPAGVIPREFPNISCRTIDLDLPHLPAHGLFKRADRERQIAAAASCIIEETSAGPSNDANAYRKGQRLRLTYQRVTVPAQDERLRLKQGGTYLITGGMGGLGMTVAEYLARSWRANLVLLGRSPLPDRDTWDSWLRGEHANAAMLDRVRKLRALEENGGTVLARSVDVTDVEAMTRLIADAEACFGALDGVFHTAGVLNDDLILLKDQSEVEESFTPKVHGTVVLDMLFKDRHLDFMLLFSSISAVTTPPGQVDYVAANAFLDAYAESAQNRADRFTASINWGPWSGVGMAETNLRKLIGEEAPPPFQGQPPRHPLLNERFTGPHGETILTMELRGESYWPLGEHRTTAGKPLMPGTGYLELLYATLSDHGEKRLMEIQDIYFFSPLFVDDSEPKSCRVLLKPVDQGYSFTVQSLHTQEEGRRAWETHARARLLPYAASREKALPLPEIWQRCNREAWTDENGPIRLHQEDFLRFGPRWRVLRQAHFGASEAMASLALPREFHEDLDHYALHPGLLDIATSFGMSLIPGYEQGNSLWVPISYRNARIYKPLPASILSWVRIANSSQENEETATFQITLTDGDGGILAEFDAFTMMRLGPGNELAVTAPRLADLEIERAAGQPGRQQLTPAERMLRHNLSQGITPEEGIEILERVLNNWNRPLIAASPLILPQLVEQTAALAVAPLEDSSKFARPELESEFLAPRDDIERKLASIWESLLGVEAAGIRDNFFDLGGHSLIAVRLFAKIKEVYGLEFPISILFEAPTIERAAELIRQTKNGGEERESPPEEMVGRKHTHLVAMHSGKGGPRTPFFLVAGMFGNVLNLRHLAHLIGHDRHFYGLQARGLYGDDPPHETFEEMAADYLAEVRTVQPEGPYFLGGFSGGGITAFEMAQQLIREGQEVRLLVMFDTPLPQRPELTRKDKLFIHRTRLQREKAGYVLQWLRDRARWEWSRLRGLLGRTEPERASTEFHSEAIEQAFRRALERYQLQPYPGRMTLFRPKLDQTYVISPDRVISAQRELVLPDNGWTPHVAELEVFEVPGDHDSMVLEPSVRVLAAKLKQSIQRVEDDMQTTPKVSN